jgi:hypothetical protein
VLFNIFILPLVTHFLLFHRILTHIALTLALHNSLESGIRDERRGEGRTSRELGETNAFILYYVSYIMMYCAQPLGGRYPDMN